MALDEKHQKAAIEMVQRNRKKKSCNKCYDRGYIGWTLDKTIIPCDKCVDIEKAMEEWKQYVADDEALKEEYHELFEEEKTEETTDESANPTQHAAENHPPVEKKTKAKSPRADTKAQSHTPSTMPRKSSRRGS